MCEFHVRVKGIQTIHEILECIDAPGPQCENIVDISPPNGLCGTTARNLSSRLCMETLLKLGAIFVPIAVPSNWRQKSLLNSKNIAFGIEMRQSTYTITDYVIVVMSIKKLGM